MQQESQFVMTVDEVASCLGVSASAVRQLARQGDIPAFKVGRQWRVMRKLLDRYLEQKAVQGAHATESPGVTEEPKQLRQGKLFHKRVQREWQQEAEGDVAVEGGVIKPSGRAGRVDVLVDAGDDLVAVVEIKASDWDRMTLDAIRRNVTRQAQQIWDYVDSQLAEGKDVCPGIIFPKRPKSRERLALIEALFHEELIQVVWQDETIEELKARNAGSDIP